MRNKDLISKHVFAGNTRLVSKVVMNEEKSGKMVATEQGSYYYHADHLGSSSVVTDGSGKFYEQIEYFPYGETWVHNKASSTQTSTPYKFTSKEQDEETGLYYYGARYYDAKMSRWISADPAMSTGDYLPVPLINDEAKEKNSKLPGMGGVFNRINLDAYHYSGQNPVKLVDPDGNWFTETYMGYGDIVHQDAITNVLGNQVNPNLLQIMQNQQIVIDKYQDNSQQYIHAMVGAGQNRAEAINKAEIFVGGWLERAIGEKAVGKNENASISFSNALHTVQDATSPSHKGFQRWDKNTDKYQHVKLEKNYPTGSTQRELEGATQWLYDIYSGKEKMPEKFFDPNTGNLNLPKKYLK